MIQKIYLTLVFALCLTLCYSQPLSTSKLDSVFQSLSDNNKFMGSMAISHEGKIVYSKTIGKADVETNKDATNLTKYRIGSISKMFTATLILKAMEEKKIDLNQTIDAYFPNIENAKKITISHLLNHRSGIHNFTADAEYSKWETQPKSEDEMITIIQNGKSDFEPNSKFQYSNSNYVLLSFILEKLYAKTYAELVTEKIVTPLGLKNTYVGGKINIANNECNSFSFSGKWEKHTETDMSIPKGAGAVVSNPTDLTQFIENLFEGKLISNESLVQMKTMKDGYGMGIYQVPFNEKIGFGHNGGIDGFQSVLYYFPADRVAIAITSNGQSYSNNDLVIAGLSWYFNKPFEIPSFKSITVKTEELDAYLGEYTSPQMPLKITITKDNATLFAQATGQSKFPLEATDKDKFEFNVAGIKLEFTPDQKQMILNQGGGRFTFTKK